MALQKKHLTKEQAVMKLRQFCAYQGAQPRRGKAKTLGPGRVAVGARRDHLRLNRRQYLNEERFAKSFAGGKFRMKDWGRKKIYYGLKEKGVGDYLIKQAMKEINEEDYRKTLHGLAEKKWHSLKGEQYLVRRKKRWITFCKKATSRT